MSNLSIETKQHWLLEKFFSYCNNVVVIQENKKYTYSDLLSLIVSQKEYLSRNNVKEGEIVVVFSNYSFISIGLFLTLMFNRNIIVPIVTKIKTEAEERLREAYVDKKIFIHGNDIKTVALSDKRTKHPIINQLQNNRNAGLILFSSGSTGKPKAMVHNLDNLLTVYKNKKLKKLNILIFLTFDHIGGLNTLLNALSMGSSIIIPDRRDPDYICSLIEKYEINVLPTSPTFLNLILISNAHTRYNLDSLRMITYGTETMPESLLHRLKNVFSKAKLLQTFGTSETGIAQTSSKTSNSTLMKIDDPNLEYKIVEGELWLKSKTQTLGYLNYKMDSFTEDGWFKTGDMVRATEDGYLKIIGRNKEIINVGGEKVLPSEVESALFLMPEIVDCMVYGEKNVITGQIVVADVVLKADTDIKNLKYKIRNFCGDKLESYKIPIKINIVGSTNFGNRYKKIRRDKKV